MEISAFFAPICRSSQPAAFTQFTWRPTETYEIALKNFGDPAKRELLRRAVTDPASFQPERTNRDITEAAAKAFADVAERMRNERREPPERVGHFVTQCLFCFFADDVGLLPERWFEKLVATQITPEKLRGALIELFEKMRTGGLFGMEDIPWFNGGLFQKIDVPMITPMGVPTLKNPRVTVWIGELQWRLQRGYPFKQNPALEPLDHIECRDALLSPVKRAAQVLYPAARGDTHVATSSGAEGEGDDSAKPTLIAQSTALTPTFSRTAGEGARQNRVKFAEARWPRADAVIGKPPFIGPRFQRRSLGDESVKGLRTVYAGQCTGGAEKAHIDQSLQPASSVARRCARRTGCSRGWGLWLGGLFRSDNRRRNFGALAGAEPGASSRE